MYPFLKLYQSVGLQEKSDYLLTLLEKNEPLKRAFLENYRAGFAEISLRSERVYERENLIQTIEENARGLQSALSLLDFEEPEWDQWTPSEENFGDDDIGRVLSEDKATEVFGPYCSDFEASLLQDDLTDIVVKLTSLVHGFLAADINDPYDYLSDPSGDFFTYTIDNLLVENIPVFGKRVFLAEEYQNSFDLVFSFNQKHYQGDNRFLRAICNFLMPLIGNREIAQLAWKAIQQYNAELKWHPKLLSHITSLLGDKDLWVESLESVFLADYDTSIQLLDYYYQNDLERFEEKALQLVEQYNYFPVDYLVDKVKKGTALHVSILKKKVTEKGDYHYFQELKQWITEAELKQFIASIFYGSIKANLYGKEGMYDELEKLIRKELQAPPYYLNFFVEAVKYLYPVNPELAWELTTLEISRMMNSDKKRKTYTYLAGLLKESFSIVGKSNEVKEKIKQLYNHLPNLPALKDEFKKADIL